MSSWVVTGTGAEREHCRTSWKKKICLFACGSQTTHFETMFELQDREFVDFAFNRVESECIYLIFLGLLFSVVLEKVDAACQRVAKKTSSAVHHRLLGVCMQTAVYVSLAKWLRVTTLLSKKVKHDSL